MNETGAVLVFTNNAQEGQLVKNLPVAVAFCLVLGGMALTLAADAAGSRPTFNVKQAPFYARCDGSTDDTRAIQAAERAAAGSGGGTVYIPAGRCMISTGIAWDSNVWLAGAGMHATTLAATSGFGFGPNRVRTGENGKLIGMIWLDGPTATSPLRNVAISNIGFDPRAGTEYYSVSRHGTYHCITANMRPVQHVSFQNLYFDLGANPRFPARDEFNGPKGFFGIELLVLGVDPNNPSHDLSFSNINGHNGIGTIQLTLGGFTNHQGVTSKAYNISIDGEHDNIDLNNILDDRIVIDGITNPAPGQVGRISNIDIRNVTTNVSDRVTVGGVNSVKINPARHTIVRDVRIDGITYRGSANGAYGSPLPNAYSKNGSGSPLAIDSDPEDGFVRNVTISNISAVNSQGILLGVGAEEGQSVNTTVSNVSLTNCYALGAAFAVSSASNHGGSDRFSISDLDISASPVALAKGRPRGLYFSSRPGAVLRGSVIVQRARLSGYPEPVTVRPGFDGLQLQSVNWNTGRPHLESAVQIH